MCAPKIVAIIIISEHSGLLLQLCLQPFLLYRLHKCLFTGVYLCHWASLVAKMVMNLPVIWETRVWSLGWQDPLEKELTTHSSTLAWEIRWTGEPGRLESVGSQRVRHSWVTNTHAHTHAHTHTHTHTCATEVHNGAWGSRGKLQGYLKPGL